MIGQHQKTNDIKGGTKKNQAFYLLFFSNGIYYNITSKIIFYDGLWISIMMTYNSTGLNVEMTKFFN